MTTRWNFLAKLLLQAEHVKAIGKAWPLFFFLVFHMDKSNKYCTNYPELKEEMGASPNTIKDWRDHLVEHEVVKVHKGNGSMSFVLQSPYDSLVTCEQDDIAQLKMVGDPAIKRVLDRISGAGNMSLLPVIAEMSVKLENLTKKVD